MPNKDIATGGGADKSSGPRFSHGSKDMLPGPPAPETRHSEVYSATRNAPPRLIRWMRVLVPIGALTIAIAVAVALVVTRPDVERKPIPERSWFISTATVAIADIQPELTLLGEVVAGQSAELRPLVGGRIVEVGKNYVEGGIVSKGELLVTIDPFDYEAALAEREAELVEAKARLDELKSEHGGESAMLEQDLEQLALARRDSERRTALRKKGSGSQKSQDDAQRTLAETQQRVIGRNEGIERLAARIERQRAVINRREVQLRKAARDLEQTRLVAPFDAFVTDRGATVGKQVSVSDRIARLIDVHWLEARFHLSDAQFARLVGSDGLRGRPATVVWRNRAKDFTFKAEIERASSEVNASSGGVDIFARIQGTGPDTVLRPGAFVEVRIPDQSYEGVIRLPGAALQGSDTVYAVIDGRLEPRKVDVVARTGNDVLVRGELKEGEHIAASTFPEIGPGVKVEVR